mgnify:CR=1 FL=1|tara:strand:+ start:330 stop:542 length:213 start_codon:yes stop_codon:yes gene_type:complete
MQYFILKKTTIGDRVEYETDYKAKKGYDTFKKAIADKIALDQLNDCDFFEYIIVNDGCAIEDMQLKGSSQ